MDIESNVPAVIEMEAVHPTAVRTLDMVANEIKTFATVMVTSAIEIGRRFVEAKAMLPRGQFGAWVQERTGFSLSTANNYMRLYTEYGAQQGNLFGAEAESDAISKLSTSQALALLALPPDEREAFAEEVDAENLSVRELQRQIDEHKRSQAATKAALDAERDKSASLQRQLENVTTQNAIQLAKVREDERSRAEDLLKLEITVARDNAEQAQKDVEKLRAALDKARAERDKYKSGANEAAQKAKERAIASMQGKLNKAEKRAREAEERAKQIQLTHEMDTEARAKQEAEEMTAELQEQLNKANAALDEANTAAQAASEAESKLRQELNAVRNQTVDNGIGKAVAQFELLFQQAVDTANRMRDIMLAARQTDAATADKLSGIMFKLSDEIRGAAT